MKLLFRSCLLVAIAFLTVSCSQKVSVPVTHTTCSLKLQVFVRQGANAGLNFTGQVTVGQDSIDIRESNSNPVTSEASVISLETNGRSIQFILYTDNGNLYGSGMMENSQQICAGTGGGVLSGPTFGDLGDWRGEWIKESFTTMEERTQTTSVLPLWICFGTILSVILIFFASLYYRILTPYKPKTTSGDRRPEKSRISTDTVKRVDRDKKTAPQGKDQALAEYQITYSADDQLFDLSFEINKSSRYIGDFGVLVAKTLDTKKTQATALEVWLFDALNAQTVSLFLLSDYCNSQPGLLTEMEQKGRLELLKPGAVFQLNTKEINVRVHVVQVDYESSDINPNSIFKKVTLKIGAWNNSI